MGSTVFFHNGFGDYVINRGALSVLATGLPGPTRLICGRGPQEFLVRDLGFEVVQTIVFSAPTFGTGRTFDAHEASAGNWSEVLVNLSSWEGGSLQALREILQPKRYVWNGDWKNWSVGSPNAVQLAAAAVQQIWPNLEIAQFRKPPSFSNRVEDAVEALTKNAAQQGFTKWIGVHADSFEDKAWPAVTFGRVLCAALSLHPDACVFVVGRRNGIAPCGCHAGRVVKLASLSLEASMCVISKMDAFFGVDSCMMKVADVVGIPGAAVFATERDVSRWGYFWTLGSNLMMPTNNDESFERLAALAISEALSR